MEGVEDFVKDFFAQKTKRAKRLHKHKATGGSNTRYALNRRTKEPREFFPGFRLVREMGDITTDPRWY